MPRQQPDWAEGDVPGEQAVDLCEAVRPSTLRSLGFRSLGLPAARGLLLEGDLRARWHDRGLFVQTFALTPRKDSPAVETAKKSLGELRHDETNHFRTDTPYAGLGDEAWSDQDRRDGEDRSRLLARDRNLIVIVDSRYGGFAPSAPARPRAAAPPGQGGRGRARAGRHRPVAASAHGYSSPWSRSSRAVTAVSGKSENTPSMPSSKNCRYSSIGMSR